MPTRTRLTFPGLAIDCKEPSCSIINCYSVPGICVLYIVKCAQIVCIKISALRVASAVNHASYD